MNIKSKIAGAVAVAVLFAGLAIPTSKAQARGGWGLGAAVLGGAIVAGAVANNAAYGRNYYVVDGYRRCRWERRFNDYGDYLGTVKVCRVY